MFAEVAIVLLFIEPRFAGRICRQADFPFYGTRIFVSGRFEIFINLNK
jgi:hypothetical protein